LEPELVIAWHPLLLTSLEWNGPFQSFMALNYDTAVGFLRAKIVPSGLPYLDNRPDHESQSLPPGASPNHKETMTP
jgi:hypothetical protein